VTELFSWTYLDGAGREVGRSEGFGDRQAAEDWMGLAWEELADQGIHEVALVEDEAGRTVYRMGLGEG
jgi:hypothetical protein